MQVVKKAIDDTKVQLTVTAEPGELDSTRQQIVKRLAKDMALPGFRAGKAPLNLVEKSIEPSRLQAEFLDEIINKLYVEAVERERVRPVDQPKVEIKKFVPFSALEFTAEVEAVVAIKLPDYTKINVKKLAVNVSDGDVDEVIKQLRRRDASKKAVKRAAKEGDEVVIDFAGKDAKTKEAINGADGKDYPLVIGSNSFIPGFEPELIGLKSGDKKTFDVTFPKDYNVSTLQNRNVSFAVTAKTVNELVEPKLDNTFAAKVGPFKSVAELKADIKKQLTAERENESRNVLYNELLSKIAENTDVSIPEAMIDEQLNAMDNEERQNLAYRGQTWQEHLKAEGISEEQHRDRNRTQAEQRVKFGLILSEIAERENIVVTPEELEIRLQIMKGQYNDKQMQAELDKPESRRDIANRMLTEKTLARLAELNNNS